MTTPYDPAQNQPGQQPMPPTAQFPQVPAGQFSPPTGQVFHADGAITALDASAREHDVDGERPPSTATTTPRASSTRSALATR
ncbi:hypothetical protein [Micromonospora chersina]|uniref:hypothetical protein n=1 Tax=Micromonospora chersina TaxID=47854 RepID=UPI0036848DC1